MMDLDTTQRLLDFLVGEQPPAGITLRKRPRKMTHDQAFALIYVLQEGFHVIPDVFEMCSYCGQLFDTEKGGHVPDDASKFYCDGCSHLCKCKECRSAAGR